MTINKVEKLLLAASNLESSGRSPFTADDLTVTAWGLWKEDFGLPGYEKKHPDSHAIYSRLCGSSRGMVNGTKLLERTKQGTYRITKLGQQCVLRLQDGEKTIYKRSGGCIRQIDTSGGTSKVNDITNGEPLKVPSLIRRLIDTAAAKIDRDGRRAEITFGMAIGFFNGEDRDDVLRQLTALGEDDDLMSGEARALRSLGEHLAERFERQFETFGNGKVSQCENV